MTVKDLIKRLSKEPPGRLVVVDGYEGGYDDVGVRVEPIFDAQGLHKGEWWRGRYGDAEDRDGQPVITAVVMKR